MRLIYAALPVAFAAFFACKPPESPSSGAALPPGNGPIHLTLVSLTDVATNLEPTTLTVASHPVSVGGFDALGGYLRLIRTQNAYSAVVASGTLFPESLASESIKNEMTLGVLNSLNLNLGFTDDTSAQNATPATGGLVTSLNFPLRARTGMIDLQGLKVGFVAATLDGSSEAAAQITTGSSELRSSGAHVVALILNDNSACDDAKFVGNGQIICREGDPVERLVARLPEGSVNAVFTENSYSSSARAFRGIPVVKNSHPGLSFNRIDLWVNRPSNRAGTEQPVVARYETHLPEFICSAHFEHYPSCQPTELMTLAQNPPELGRLTPARYEGARVSTKLRTAAAKSKLN
jgi:hypothetical protein